MKNHKIFPVRPFTEILRTKIQNMDVPIGFYSVENDFRSGKNKQFYIQNNMCELGSNWDAVSSPFGDVSFSDYPSIIRGTPEKWGMGTQGGCRISLDEKKNVWRFQGYDLSPTEENIKELSYTDGIKLFHAYFNAFREFVEKYAPELKEQKEWHPRNGYIEPWYPDFLTELEKLNALYDQMVKKGEIVEEEK